MGLERKCDYPAKVKSSDGRATCGDANYAKFRVIDNCSSCPKVKLQISFSNGMTPDEKNKQFIEDTAVNKYKSDFLTK